MLYIVCWRCSSIHICYGISQKLFIRYLKNRALLEADPGHLPGQQGRWNYLQQLFTAESPILQNNLKIIANINS